MSLIVNCEFAVICLIYSVVFHITAMAVQKNFKDRMNIIGVFFELQDASINQKTFPAKRFKFKEDYFPCFSV